MTAEIALMNGEAVALASDSAVTMGEESEQKIFTSASKLFALSKYHPVGIMVYGNAKFMDIPWETIVKIYRNKLGKSKFNTLKEYAKHFVDFLDNGNPLFPDIIQDDYFRDSVFSYLNFMKNQIEEKVHIVMDEKSKIPLIKIKQLINEIIDNQFDRWIKSKTINSIPRNFDKKILLKYKSVILEAIAKVFEKLPLSKQNLNQLTKIATCLFLKFPEDIEIERISGVVIAGFGDKDTFPSLESFNLEGIIINRLKYEPYLSRAIGVDSSAAIIPFAQREMVVTFMEGLDPFYNQAEESYLLQVFNDFAEMMIKRLDKYNNSEKEKLKEQLKEISSKILEDRSERMEKYRKIEHVDPILDVVAFLPKDELAAMAESLVNLTSFKRKVTMESETVDGPIDVAVISKGDGFI